jgi:hypothetical protein
VGFEQTSWQDSVRHESNWFEDFLELSQFIAITSKGAPQMHFAGRGGCGVSDIIQRGGHWYRQIVLLAG